MTRATTLRRTYTTARQNDDDSQSSDDSVMISSTSSSTGSASESEKKTYASEKISFENFIKNTSNTEVGKLKKKYLSPLVISAISATGKHVETKY